MGRCGRPDYLQDARVHCAVLKQRTVTPIPPTTRPHHRPGPCDPDQTTSDVTGIGALHETTNPPPPPPQRAEHSGRPVPSGPNSVPTARPPPPPRSPPRKRGGTCGGSRPPAELVSVPPSSSTPTTRRHPELGAGHGPGMALDHSSAPGADQRPVLLRKEVIQPHLPV